MQVYARKVEALTESLAAEPTRLQAADAIRGLVEKVVVHRDAATGEHGVELVGELAALLAALLAAGTNEDAAAYEAAASSLDLVAGAGFEPAAFRL